MPIDLYQPITNEITGETFKCISFDKESYKMEWTVSPQGYVAFEHIHYYQDEIFFVKSGQINVTIQFFGLIGSILNWKSN